MDLKDKATTRIGKLGLKKSHVASQIGVTPVELSHFLKGRRQLRPEAEVQLKRYLDIG